MKKVLRIGYNRWYDNKIFEEHLNYVKENKDVIDEITLFDGFSHYGYQTLETCRENAKILTDRIARYREAGIKSVGVNILSTIGHLEEGWGALPKAELQYMVNENGEISKACLCPTNEEFLKYTAAKYAEYAKTGADFVWYDDDLRVYSHGIAQHGCFCDKCIEKFNAEYSASYNREALANAIRTDKNVNQQWLEFHTNALIRLVRVIGNSVRGASSNTKVAAMTTPTNIECTSDKIEASSAEMCRPGGGFYNDNTPTDVLLKIFETQLQLGYYPSKINDIQYEYEAFNYQNLNKSMQMTDIETVLAIFSGCTGVLYNNDIFNDRDDIIELFRNRKDMWDTLSSLCINSTPCGIYCTDPNTAKALNQIGICTTTSKDKSVGALLPAHQLVKLSDSELDDIVNMPLFTDGDGLSYLCEKGYGKQCGGKVKKIYESGMAERFSQNELNGNFKNYYRDVFMNFFNEGLAYEFEVSDSAEILANLETITHISGGCAMYMHNKKFVADGYFMPNSLLSSAKQEQLLNVFDTISDGSLPLRIKKSLRVAPFVSTDSNGKMIIILVNLSLDETESFDVEIRNNGSFYQLNKDGKFTPVSQTSEGKNTIISIDNIERMDYIILTER